jgi:hypothetical protein
VPFSALIVEIPLGHDGLTGIENPVVALPSQLLEATYVDFQGQKISKEGAQAPFTPAALGASVLNGHDWWATSTVQRQVVLLGNGTVRKDSGSGAFATTLASGLTVTQPSQFVDAGAEKTAQPRKLILFTGTNAPQVLAGDGATMTALATPAADWTGPNQPLCGAVHANRLWAAGNLSDPHRVYFSTVDNHENFTDATNAGSLPVFPGEGDRIIGMFSYRGLLIVGKAPRGIYVIDTTGIQITSYAVNFLSHAIGMASANAIAQVDNDVLFLDSAANMQSTAAVQALGDLSTQTYGQAVDLPNFLTQRVNAAASQWARMAYYGLKRELHIAVAGTGSATNNARLVVDFNGPTRERFRYSSPEPCPALWLMRMPATGSLHPMRGDTSGVVWHMDQPGVSPAGVPGQASRILTPALDLGHADPGLAGRMKQGHYLELVTTLDGPWNLDFDIYWDGRKHQSLAFGLRNSYGLPAGQVVNLQQRLLGSGRRIQFDIRQTVGSQSFSVYRLYMGFSALDSRQSEVFWR